MTLRAKNLLCEKFPLSETDITEKDGKYILDTKVSKMEGVGRFVIGLMGDIRVLDSPELEKYVQEYVQKKYDWHDDEHIVRVAELLLHHIIKTIC